VLRERRLAGGDPAHGGNAAKFRGRRNSVTLLANAEWERNQTEETDPAIFEKEIKPKLKTVSLAETMSATGLSRTYCGLIRRGVRIPHPRHWEVLRELVKSPCFSRRLTQLGLSDARKPDYLTYPLNVK